jgi:hypothetical protein
MKRVLVQHKSAILKLKVCINAHTSSTSVAFKDDSSQIVSGFENGTIKVWDAINFRPHVESEWEEFEKTVDAEDSDEEDEIETWWRNKITGHEQYVKPSGSMCPPMNPGRSKSGTQVSRYRPDTDLIRPDAMPSAPPCRHSRAQGDQGERPQRLGLLGRLLARRQDHRLRLKRPDDQSLGRR